MQIHANYHANKLARQRWWYRTEENIKSYHHHGNVLINFSVLLWSSLALLEPQRNVLFSIISCCQCWCKQNPPISNKKKEASSVWEVVTMGQEMKVKFFPLFCSSPLFACCSSVRARQEWGLAHGTNLASVMTQTKLTPLQTVRCISAPKQDWFENWQHVSGRVPAEPMPY